MSKLKVTVSIKNEGSETFTLDNKKTVDQVITLAKTEEFRKDILRGIDLTKSKLRFEVNGDRYTAAEIIKNLSGLKDKNGKTEKEDKKKKKKDKKKTKDKKNKKNKFSKLNRGQSDSLDIENGIVVIHGGNLRDVE